MRPGPDVDRHHLAGRRAVAGLVVGASINIDVLESGAAPEASSLAPRGVVPYVGNWKEGRMFLTRAFGEVAALGLAFIQGTAIGMVWKADAIFL